MNVKVTGKSLEVADGITVLQLMEQQNVESPQYVTVALNQTFLRPDDYSEMVLQEGDTIEFLYFMGGGAHGTDE